MPLFYSLFSYILETRECSASSFFYCILISFGWLYYRNEWLTCHSLEEDCVTSIAISFHLLIRNLGRVQMGVALHVTTRKQGCRVHIWRHLRKSSQCWEVCRWLLLQQLNSVTLSWLQHRTAYGSTSPILRAESGPARFGLSSEEFIIVPSLREQKWHLVWTVASFLFCDYLFIYFFRGPFLQLHDRSVY